MRTYQIFYDVDGGGGGGGGGSGNPGSGGGEGGGGKTVSWENFQAVVSAKTGLEGQVRELQGQVRTLQEKAATVDTLSTQINEWKTEAAEAEGRYTAFIELSGALGTTDADVIGAFDQRYRALPEKDRPPRADWIGSLKAKPGEAPALLRPWLSQPQGAGPRPNPKPVGPPTAPAASGEVTAEAVRAARERAQKTGDWGPYKELTKQMGLRS